MRALKRAGAALLVVAWAALPARAAAPPTEITTCGQSFSDSGFLSGDLDCAGFAGGSAAITIDGGTLDLRGFTLTGNTYAAVSCTKGCTVTSSVAGGTIDGETEGILISRRARIQGITIDGPKFAVDAFEPVSVSITDSTILSPTYAVLLTNGGSFRMGNCTVDGIVSTSIRANIRDSDIHGNVEGGRVAVRRSSIVGSGGDGVDGNGRIVLIDSIVSGHALSGLNGYGHIRVKRSEVSANGEFGINAGSDTAIALIDATIHDNTAGGVFQTGSIKGLAKVVRSSVTDNGGDGVHVIGPVKLTASTVTGNGGSGIYIPHSFSGSCELTVAGSSVIGNGTGPSCGVSETCADLASCISPDVKPDSSCDTSYDVNSGFPGTSWGVCLNDIP